MAPLVVDPMALNGAGSSVMSVGEELGTIVKTLTGALGGCSGMCGDDPAGGRFGRDYDATAGSLIDAMVAVGNGISSIGFGVQMSATNYSRAEASSDITGRGQPLPAPQQPAKIAAGSVPSGAGGAVAAPLGWGWVAPYIGMIWPTTDTGRLRGAAAAWMTAGSGFVATEVAAAGPLGVVGAQQIPEGEPIGSAFAVAARSGADILAQANELAAQLVSYAGKADAVRSAIVDLLAEIADPFTGVKLVWDWFTDDDEKEIERIAGEIRTVINHFKSEVDAIADNISDLASAASMTVSGLTKWADKEWSEFSDDTPAGRVVEQIGQYAKGAWQEAGGMVKDSVWTYSNPRMLIDPEGFQRDLEALRDGLAPLVGLGGDDAPGVAEAWKDLGKTTVHWDLWSENPAEAAGRSVIDIGSLFIPGAGWEAKAVKTTHAAADAAEAAVRAEVPQADLPRVVEAPNPPAEVPKPPAATPKPAIEAPQPSHQLDASPTPPPPPPDADPPPVTERTVPAVSQVPAGMQHPVEVAESSGVPAHAEEHALAAAHTPGTPAEATASAPQSTTTASASQSDAPPPSTPPAAISSPGVFTTGMVGSVQPAPSHPAPPTVSENSITGSTPDRVPEGHGPPDTASSDSDAQNVDEAPIREPAFDLTSPRADELGYDPAKKGFRLDEAETAMRVEWERGISLRRVPDGHPADWIDTGTGATYDAVGNFPSKFFEDQWSNLKLKIVDHLRKADYVPVDVSLFSEAQREVVRQYTNSLGTDRVFIIGEYYGG